MSLAEEMGLKVEFIRNRNNQSQEEMAEKLGVTKEDVVAWETGRRTLGEKNLVNFAKAYGVSTDFLLGLLEKQSVEVMR